MSGLPRLFSLFLLCLQTTGAFRRRRFDHLAILPYESSKGRFPPGHIADHLAFCINSFDRNRKTLTRTAKDTRQRPQCVDDPLLPNHRHVSMIYPMVSALDCPGNLSLSIDGGSLA